MKYKMQEVQYNKTILAQQKKLDFYSCNSHVHPDNDEKIDISILSQNAFKAIQKVKIYKFIKMLPFYNLVFFRD